MWCVAWWRECEPSTMSCCVVGLLLAWVLCARAPVRADAPARTRIFIRTRTHMCPSMGGVAVCTSPLTPPSSARLCPPHAPFVPPSVLLALLSRPLVPACYLRGVLLVCCAARACGVVEWCGWCLSGCPFVLFLVCGSCVGACVVLVVPGLASCVVRGVVVGV